MPTYILYDGAYAGEQIDAFLHRIELTAGAGALQPQLAGTIAEEIAYGQAATVRQRTESNGTITLIFGVPRGATGAQGVTGPPGAAAGFGTPTVTIDDTVGTPSVLIGASGPDTAKVFAFRFSGLKGKSAYQYAVESGYTGTEAQFSSDLSNFTVYVVRSETAATTAAQKATEAASSATTATQQAAAAASSAQSSASSATTATQKASQASLSAQNAALSAQASESSAATSAQQAAASSERANAAHTSAVAAAESAGAARDSALLSQSWAVGDTGFRVGEDENNSKYWAMLSMQFMIRQMCPVILDSASGTYYAVAIMAGRITLISVYAGWAQRVSSFRAVPCMDDEVTGDRYKLGVHNGVVCLEEVSQDTQTESPEFIDFVTGITFEFISSNERIIIKEVG